jgi:hypothetical protein
MTPDTGTRDDRLAEEVEADAERAETARRAEVASRERAEEKRAAEAREKANAERAANEAKARGGVIRPADRQKMDVQQAAATIRAELAEPPPEARHMGAFAERVCAELGMDQTPMNVARVIHSLNDHGIEPAIAEYPKWVGQDENGIGGVIVHSEQEESDYLAKMGSDPEAAAADAQAQAANRRGVSIASTKPDNVAPVNTKPRYEPGALPGEPGGQDGPEANPTSTSGMGGDLRQGGAPPAQVIQPVRNEPAPARPAPKRPAPTPPAPEEE